MEILNLFKMWCIAIDMGGTLIKIGLIFNGSVHSKTTINADSINGLKARIPYIEIAIEDLLAGSNIEVSQLKGIGISIPGIVDFGKKTLLSVNQKFKDATGFNFPEWVQEKWSLPVLVENDARAAMIGEWIYGAGRGCDDLVMVTLGTGIGGAAISEGRVLRGKHFQAGCLGGHFTINYKGATCTCGNIGCVEAEASTWQLPNLAKEHPLYIESQLSKISLIDYEQVFALAHQGDLLARELLDQSLLAWSTGIVNMIHAYDPEKVIIGGGIMQSFQDIIPFIQMYVDRHAWTPWGSVEVLCAADINGAALKGMSYLVHQLTDNRV
jgi:glucokinase